MIKTIIFDLNKVIIQFNSWKSEDEFKALTGVDSKRFWDESVKYYHELDSGRLGKDEYLENVLKDLNCPIDIKDKVLDLILKNLDLVDGTLDIVRKLRKSFRVVLLAGDSKEFFELKENIFSLNDEFDAVYASYQFRTSKDYPEIFKKVIQIEEINPAECLFIDDLQIYIDAAKKAGIQNTIKFIDSGQLEFELKRKQLL